MTQRDARHWKRSWRAWNMLAILMVGFGLVFLLIAVGNWRLAGHVEGIVAGLAARDADDPAIREGQELIAQRWHAVWRVTFWAVVSFALAVASRWLAKRAEREQRRLTGRCVKCDYDLRGLPEPRCPECGTPFNPKEYPDLSAPRPERRSE